MMATKTRERAFTELPVLEVVSGLHIVTDPTLGLGKVVQDYLA